jgi:hypothetical protein
METFGDEPVPMTHHSLQIPRASPGIELTPSRLKAGDEPPS